MLERDKVQHILLIYMSFCRLLDALYVLQPDDAICELSVCFSLSFDTFFLDCCFNRVI